MSGGVDSSVAAAVLQRDGYEVTGISMSLWCAEKDGPAAEHRSCCSADDMNDAERVCRMLGIPFYRLNMQDAFKAFVVDYFCREYARGRTPNPCIACNHHLKFDKLLQYARSLGARLATGHYARVQAHPKGYRLLKGTDASKDQSYFLFSLGQQELAELLFPVGDRLKKDVRLLAKEIGLPTAVKKESQDLCFISGRDYRHFLAERLALKTGEIVDHERRTLGRHAGVALYTIGQRKGLGLYGAEPLYVTGLDAVANAVVVGPETDLLSYEVEVNEVTWVSGKAPSQPFPARVKVRYRSPASDATVMPELFAARVSFRQPQRAIAPGQAAVFYDSDAVLGGGFISRVVGLGEGAHLDG